MSHRARRVRHLPAGALALAIALAIAGCVPSHDAAESAAPENGSTPTISDRLDDDGMISMDLALDLFAAAFGPIEGGDAAAVDVRGGSGSMAVRGMLSHWQDLSTGQRAAVEAILAPSSTPGAGAAGAGPGGATAAGPRAHSVAALPMEPSEEIRGLTALVAELQAEFEGLLGKRLGVPIETSAVSDSADSTIDAAAWPTVGDRVVETGRMEVCRIGVWPLGWDFIDTPQFRTIIAHEVMHCFQYDGPGGIAPVLKAASWIVEGGPTFAAMTVASTDYFGWAWQSWLESPGVPVYKRDYDAIGVFAVAQQEGADVWQHLIPLLHAEGTAAGLELLFERPLDEAMTATARRLVRETDVGPAWESRGPGITGTRGAVGIGIRDGASITEEAAILPFATAPYIVDVDPGSEVVDVVVLGGRGVLGVPGGGTEQVGPEFGGRYCLTGFCECPEGGSVGGIEIPPGGPIGIGLIRAQPAARDHMTVTLQISVISLVEACGNRVSGEVLIVRFHEPEPFEVHGGHCIRQAGGDLLIQAGDGRMPEGYDAPPEHRDDVSMSIYKNPTSPPDAGSVDLRIGGAPHVGGSTIIVSPDRLSGSFALDSGYAGEWACVELLSPADAFGTG